MADGPIREWGVDPDDSLAEWAADAKANALAEGAEERVEPSRYKLWICDQCGNHAEQEPGERCEVCDEGLILETEVVVTSQVTALEADFERQRGVMLWERARADAAEHSLSLAREALGDGPGMFLAVLVNQMIEAGQLEDAKMVEEQALNPIQRFLGHTVSDAVARAAEAGDGDG